MKETKTFVVLLRAVNVGGTGKLSMADFRAALEELKYRDIQTYIQSGNAVFAASGDAKKIAAAIAERLQKRTGARTEVMVRTHEQLGAVIAGNPYAAEAAENGAKVHVAFLAGPAAETARAALEAIVARYPSRRDRYHLAGSHIYFHFPDGAAETKFTGKTLDRAIGVAGTARNWNTVLKVYAMSER